MKQFNLIKLGFLVLLLLVQLGNSQPSEVALSPNVSKIHDVQGNLVLFSGRNYVSFSDPDESILLPDGFLWLLDKSTNEIQLLTSPHIFGNEFFGAGGVITPDKTAIFIKVNVAQEQRLYKVTLPTYQTELVAEVSALGLEEILEDTMVISNDGKRLAFIAYS